MSRPGDSSGYRAGGRLLPTFAFGTAPLASIFWDNDEPTAVAAVRVAAELGVSMFDTAPLYGLGEAEERVRSGLDGRPGMLLTSKVGRTVTGEGDGRDAVFDYSRDGVLRQVEASLSRLGTDRLDIAHVHDPEDHLDAAVDTALPALIELRDQGVVGAVSVGTNECATVLRLLETEMLDVAMLAGRLTLLDRSAASEVVPACREAGVPLLAAGVFNSGILADPSRGRWFDYAPAEPAVVDRALTLQRICSGYGVQLRSAAMQFPLRFPGVATVVVGMASAEQVRENLGLFHGDVPDSLWEELDAAR